MHFYTLSDWRAMKVIKVRLWIWVSWWIVWFIVELIIWIVFVLFFCQIFIFQKLIWKLFTCEHDHVILSIDEIPSITLAGTLINLWFMGISHILATKAALCMWGRSSASQGGKHEPSTPFILSQEGWHPSLGWMIYKRLENNVHSVTDSSLWPRKLKLWTFQSLWLYHRWLRCHLLILRKPSAHSFFSSFSKGRTFPLRTNADV